jgi:hypothetical protein
VSCACVVVVFLEFSPGCLHISNFIGSGTDGGVCDGQGSPHLSQKTFFFEPQLEHASRIAFENILLMLFEENPCRGFQVKGINGW